MNQDFDIELVLTGIKILPHVEARQAAFMRMLAHHAGVLVLEPDDSKTNMIDSSIQTVNAVIEKCSNMVHKLKGEELATVAGGKDDGDKEDSPDCFFTPTGNTKKEYSHLWHECASKCHNSLYCYCHNKSNCINRWHRMDEREELYNQNESNHNNKKKSKRYSANSFRS